MATADSDGWVTDALRAACELAASVDAVGLALVGSRARGDAREDSDVDLVLLLSEPERLLGSDSWFTAFGPGAVLVRSEQFGALQERRLRLADGHVVEVCVGTGDWAAVRPVDQGTAAVVRGGFRALHDPHGFLATLVAEVDGHGV